MSYEMSAPVYDAIYTKMKDYRAEAERVHELIQTHGHSESDRLLDAACGTGLHAFELTKWYEIVGYDLSTDQLAIARKRLPSRIDLFEGDMRTFRLGYTTKLRSGILDQFGFGAVVCLFSAIGHVTKLQELHQTIANMAECLRPGGVLLIEPWLLPHMWQPGHFSMETANLPELKVARMSHSTREGNLIHLELEHLVGTLEGNQHFVETHDLMMYTEDEFLDAFARAGLTGFYDPAGINTNQRGIFIATKPLQ